MSWSTDDVYPLCPYLVTVGELAHSGLDGFEHTLDGFEHTMVGSLIPPPPDARSRTEPGDARVERRPGGSLPPSGRHQRRGRPALAPVDSVDGGYRPRGPLCHHPGKRRLCPGGRRP